MRLSFVLSTVTALLVSSLVHSSQAQKLCNGYAELCAKPYNKVAFATTHNAFASSAGALGANQNHAISVQLKDGIRALMLDSYNPLTGNTGDIQLCHTACTVTISRFAGVVSFSRSLHLTLNNPLLSYSSRYSSRRGIALKGAGTAQDILGKQPKRSHHHLL